MHNKFTVFMLAYAFINANEWDFIVEVLPQR